MTDAETGNADRIVGCSVWPVEVRVEVEVQGVAAVVRGKRLFVGGTASVLVVAAGTWAVRDYRSWRGLGVGGLPANPLGWLTTTRLRFRGRDPFRVSCPGQGPVSAVLVGLPTRDGARPQVARHPIPHRVLGRPASESLREEIRGVFDEFAARRAPALEYRTSRWEKHHRALFALSGDDDAHATSGEAGHEVGHVHPADGSMHMVLGPADAQHVIDRGWGELHPLAGVAYELPAGYTLLYPPRTHDDIDPLRTILSAAVHHTTGEPPVADTPAPE
ncbi:luciferase family protein [Streptomyces sp. SID3343]|uniref:luciferase domain-containing protein n=1 Tax=Streptomyces sp. SID3343 TaxID=2690260 RepID=UPI00136B38AC|nr:hypothetical protein [Streptomyces sp. SID3343]